MKHLLLLSAVLLCTTAFAQNYSEQVSPSLHHNIRKAEQNDGSIYLNDLITHYNSKGAITQKAEYEFDESGRISAEYIYNLSGNEVVSTYKNTDIVYDDKGNILKYTGYVLNDDGEWQKNSLMSYTYDDHNRQSALNEFILKDGEEVQVQSIKIEIKYDEHGNVIDEKTEVWYEGECTTTNTKHELEYNDNGLVKTDIYHSYSESSGSQWESIYKYSYTYNKSGKPTNVYIYNWINNKWTSGSKIVYSYDSNGNQTKMIVYGYTNGSYVTMYSETYHYITFNTPVESILATPTDAVPRKILKDGKISILHGNYHYGLSGERIK